MNVANALHNTLILTGLGTLVLGPGAAARPNIRTSATASAGVAYERNPFLVDAEATDAVSGQFELTPRIEITDVRSSAAITGYYNRSEYLSRYDGTNAAAIAAVGSSQITSRLRLGSSIRFDSSVLGGANAFGFNRGLNSTGLFMPPSNDASSPAETETVIGANFTPPAVSDRLASDANFLGGDIGLIGRRQRRDLLSTGVNASYQPGARGTWVLGVNADRAWYPGDGFVAQSYRSVGGSFGYSHATSETTNIGAQISASQIDYELGRRTRIYSPQVTFAKRLPSSWSVNVAAGASFVRSNDIATLSGSNEGTTLNIQVGFCRSAARSTLCVVGNRTPSANGFSGVNTATSIQANHNIRLDASSSMSTYVSYSRNEADRTTTFMPTDQELIAAGTSYNRRLNDRISLIASAQYRDVKFANSRVQADLSARLGISASFGKIQ